MNEPLEGKNIKEKKSMFPGQCLAPSVWSNQYLS